MLQAGERIGGRYVLEQRLGLGGMGEVWLAELEGAGRFRRRVVVKVLAQEPGLNPVWNWHRNGVQAHCG